MIKFCTNCGSQVTPEQRFCTKCGAPLAVTEAPAPEYLNTLQIILKLGKAGVVDDVLDEPEGLDLPAQSAWTHDQLAAINHKWVGAEFKVVFAASNLDVTSYSSLTNREPGTSSMRFGNWIVYVTPSTGQTVDSAAVLEKLFALLG